MIESKSVRTALGVIRIAEHPSKEHGREIDVSGPGVTITLTLAEARDFLTQFDHILQTARFKADHPEYFEDEEKPTPTVIEKSPIPKRGRPKKTGL